MAYVSDMIDRTARVLPQTHHADWLLRLPLALVLLQYGFDKFPLSADVAAGWGLPLFLWGLAGVAEIVVALMLVAGGMLRNRIGEVVTRIAGIGAALIVIGVIIVAYWAPPLDLILFNQFHILLLCAGLYLALSAPARKSEQG
ncbi:MAG: hypothetical protein EA407_02745 [Rhodobacteraceae bacterium]|nr:MAG: hypothetical protein EA407_02745 [Paracoccaceae bacterium]